MIAVVIDQIRHGRCNRGVKHNASLKGQARVDRTLHLDGRADFFHEFSAVE